MAAPIPQNPSATVRPAARADVERLVEFNRAMARETEGLELSPERLREGIAALFEHPERGAYLVAESVGEVVGCLMVTTEWSDWRNGDFWWIQSVYVDPAHRGLGVFGALYRRLLSDARANGRVCGLRLYVERENRSARSIYESLGMEASRYRMYELEFAVPGEPSGEP